MARMTRMAAEGDSPACLIEPEDHARFVDVNVQPFGFRHRLNLESIFNLDEVLAMAGRLPDGDAFKGWQNGKVGLADGWNTRPEDRLSLEQTLDGLAENDSVVVFKHVEQDKVFGPILQDVLQEVFRNSSREFRDEVIVGECLIFLNSPGRKTPYHFDLEASFLLQVQGEKTAYAWPCGDRTLVPDSEIADYCGAGNLSAAVYKPERQGDAKVFKLLPGDGVHFPSLGPHWVQNGDSVSISVNVNYDVRSLHRQLQHTLGFNHRMRKLGLQPGEPGRHPWVDDLKARAWMAALKARRSVHSAMGRKQSGAGYPVWRPQH